MFNRFLAARALAAAIAVAPVAGFAQGVSSADPAAVPAGAYKVEPSHTQVGFTLLHMGFSNYSGVFSDVSGSLQLDTAHPGASKLAITIPIASVQTTSTKLDGELKSAAWFDAGQFPNATFTSTKITRTGARPATIVGDLTLHGVTHPVTLSAHLIGSGVNPLDKAQTVGFQASGTIARSDFGVKTYVPLIGDKVTLTIAGVFERQG